jgi:hypothetical protein
VLIKHHTLEGIIGKIIHGNSTGAQNFQRRSHHKSLFYLEQEMSWTTIYITGNSDFREEVKKRLEHSEIDYMPGFIESSTSDEIHDLYWIDHIDNLRAFKLAIGGKLVWKYRLRFYSSLESFLASQQAKTSETAFTDQERKLIARMQAIL